MKAIITGAASGIGRATAFRFAADAAKRGEHACLLLTDIDNAKLEVVAHDMRTAGASVEIVVGDLADPLVPQDIVRKAIHRFGGLDLLVSNAGILTHGPLVDVPIEDWDRNFAVNTRATWLLAKAAYPHLKLSKGNLIAITSLSAQDPTPPLSAYAMSKAALEMLVRQLSYEWGPDGIRCNCVLPGSVLSGMSEAVYADPVKRAAKAAMIPLRRVGMPEDIAGAIAFLAGADASFITGATISVDGGAKQSLMPLQSPWIKRE